MTFYSKIRNLLSAPQTAVDLGTANTRIFTAYAGTVVTPTVLKTDQPAVETDSNRASRAGSCKLVKPLRGGVITNPEVASKYLSQRLKKNHPFDRASSHILICTPSDITAGERSILLQTLHQAGAASVKTVSGLLAAAIGSGIEVASPYSQMIIDIGEGVTDIGIINEGVLTQTSAVRTAGGDLRNALREAVLTKYQIQLSEDQTETILRRLAIFNETSLPDAMNASGTDEQQRNFIISISNRLVFESIMPVAKIIVENIKQTLKNMPPENYVEIVENGLVLTGGVAQLPGFAEFISEETNLSVRVAAQPLFSAINGARLIMETERARKPWLS